MSIARVHVPRFTPLTCQSRRVSFLVKPWLGPSSTTSPDDEADVRAIQDALKASRKPPMLRLPPKQKYFDPKAFRLKLRQLVEDYNADTACTEPSEALSPDAVELYPQDLYLSRLQALGAKPEEDVPLLKVPPLPEELQTANVSAQAKKMRAVSKKARSRERQERYRTQKFDQRRSFVETQEDVFADFVNTSSSHRPQ